MITLPLKVKGIRTFTIIHILLSHFHICIDLRAVYSIFTTTNILCNTCILFTVNPLKYFRFFFMLLKEITKAITIYTIFYFKIEIEILGWQSRFSAL